MKKWISTPTFGLDLSDHKGVSSDCKIFYPYMVLSPSEGSYNVKIHTTRFNKGTWDCRENINIRKYTKLRHLL